MTMDAARSAGLAQLADFVPRAGRAYSAERNFDRGPTDRGNVSALSPWVRHRLVTEHDVVDAVLQRHSLEAASKFVQEVYWRTYWKGWLELRPSVWTRYVASVQPGLDALSAADRASFDAAVTGRTGIEGFDDWARELVDTGYLHNHARMWFASIWIFTLRLPWQLGADFFMRNLLDGDPASNTLSWRWVAGLQTVGKTYLATTQNIEFATEGRFRPTGLATTAVAVGDDAPPPTPLAAPTAEPLPGGRVALLLHEDDLHAESLAPLLEAAGAEVVAVAAPLAGEPRSPVAKSSENPATPASPLVTTFTARALTDGCDRASAHFAAETTALGSLTASAVLPWLHASGLTQLVTPYAPVGPVRDRLDLLTNDLAGEGITLSRAIRSWDARAWPHATRGFFPFREQIPKLLREERL
jgi:deoxyribodipyrimidine photo-lyase